MKIEAVRIQSFKSFDDSGWVELSEHFTILVGQNNAGKSAFLQSFTTTGPFIANPHHSARLPEGAASPESVISFRLKIDGQELLERALHWTSIQVPTTHNVGKEILTRHFTSSHLHVLEMRHGTGNFRMPASPAYGLFDTEQKHILTLDAYIDRNTRNFGQIYMKDVQPPEDRIPSLVADVLARTTFLFNAERYSIGRCPMDGKDRLDPDARNLPYMLLKLNKSHKRIEQFQELVSEVLPSIKRILISAMGQEVEISVQSHGSMREDLAISLNECGTGVAQVLAILYVAVAYPAAQIIIDEPNSFLHPAATRRLLNVLRRFDQHQFLLSTHAPEVIAATRPEKLMLLRWDEEQSQTVITSNSGEDIDHIRTSLSEIGGSLADIFGYDVVVFVEGPTEKACFPLLLTPENRTAINFVAMREASGLTSTKPQALFDIYAKGVASSALLPPVTRFSFDREGRSEPQRADILRASRGAARFLPRPMFENYLLHPAALSALLQRLDGQNDKTAPDAISRWIDAHYAKHTIKDVPNTSAAMCDAAKLLSAMFDELTENRFEYRKVEHGEDLTRWLLDNDPSYLGELVAHIKALLER
ncbi:ATP-dependent nuclease [Rhizobium laguerreae]|uniref:ATP-dependent nuclease n=1 Tax=Rhizobium laguerreae TaxID=1076926 RepID=UPI001C906EA6|nr:AAA family ATPase [Rhizobium laguerreae]MBY3040107.1 AAA family ATPase [Rhizobium laguerreae]